MNLRKQPSDQSGLHTTSEALEASRPSQSKLNDLIVSTKEGSLYIESASGAHQHAVRERRAAFAGTGLPLKPECLA